MPIAAGTRLASFEILSLLGAGGMGEVYKARDTRLDRIVAIKVLPAHLADNPELRERFEREARTIASLSHPHICTLHDIGRQDGIDFLVMEYLEGETLSMRLLKGPLPTEQVLRCAIEISDALDKAHRKGVTHRDIKPGNVMVTKNGSKLLDFGLAKLKQEAAPANVPFSQLPTLKENPTLQGTILGTLQYMAPEQVEGKVDELDGRTDIFAFGSVVYEMVTGKRAFEGKSAASLIGAIMNLDPPGMATLQPMTPPALDRVVKTCLAKDPDERWQTAGDLCRELKWIAESRSQVNPSSADEAKDAVARRRSGLLWGAACLFLVAIAGLVGWNLKPVPSPRPVTRTVITLPPGQQLAGLDNGPAVSLAPDGTHLAYVATQRSTQQLYLRAMDSLDAKPIPGTEGANSPSFSPDGQWLGFFAGGNLKKVSASGGAALTLGGTAMNPRGATWGGQGMVFTPTGVSALQQVSDAGGTPQPLTHLDKGESSHRWPEFLPSGKAVLFAAATNSSNWTYAQIAVQSIGTGERRNLVQGGTQPRYASSGHLVYAQGGSLMAVSFDAQRLAVTGTAVPVVEGVLQSPGTGAAQYSLSDNGALVYVPGGIQGIQRRLVWVDRKGTEQSVVAPAHDYAYPRLSPDGRRIAVGIDGQVWLYELARETLTRLTVESGAFPIWTPDGKRIAFESNKEGIGNIFWQPADGSGKAERLASSEHFQNPSSFSPDGQLLAFYQLADAANRELWVLRLSDRKPQPFLQTPFNIAVPMFSPDGRWLVYVSNESGRVEIYAQAYPGPGGKWQVSTEGGSEPVWNRNGRELFYRNGDKMMVVDVTTQPSFSVGKPRVLFEGQYLFGGIDFPNYDVSPDGRRFLMVKEGEQATAATQIVVVQNWFEELKRRVSASKP